MISENIYNELIYTTGKVNGWKTINKSKMYIIPAGGPFSFSTLHTNNCRYLEDLAQKL